MLWYYNQEFRWGRHTCDWILIEIFDICKLCSIFNRRTFLMNRLLRSWEGTTYIWGRISRAIWLITSYGLYKVIVRDEKILKSFIEDVLLEEVCDSGFPGGAAAAAATLLQLCPTLCDPIDRSPPGSPVPGILQARTLEWAAISFSNAWKWKVKVKLLSRVRLLATPWTAAHQAPPSRGFSRQEDWSGVPLPSLPRWC